MIQQTTKPTPTVDDAPVSADIAVSNFGKWMALLAALLGWLFDGLEMGLFPLVQGPALADLQVPPGEVVHWIGIITAFFLIGAATGGVLFGWLGDRLGRVRAMMLSVLTYALCSGMCGFAASAWQVGILRFLAALGMGGEWALGVALINEIWPGRSRAFLAGLVGAAGNVGYLLIALIGLGVLNQIQSLRSIFEAIFPQEFADTLLRGQAWRLMMIVGALPALLTFFIRAFVPESARWERENRKGNTSHWLSRDLLGVLLGSLGACALIWLWAPKGAEWEMHLGLKIFGSGLCVFIVASGYTYPVIRFLQRLHATDPTQPAWRPMLRRMLLAACLSGVALIGTWGSVQQAPTYAIRVAEAAGDGQLAYPKETTQISTALGAIIATILAALMGDWLGRRITYCLMCVGSLVIIPLFYQIPNSVNYEFLAFAFLLGGITAAFYGWLPLYLPELFRTSMRATGQGFGFNFGRVLAAIGVLQLGSLTEFATRSESTARLGGLPAVCSTLSVVYIAGLFLIWLVPETRGKPLPE